LKKKILFIVQLPPPIHGASIRNQAVVNNKLINKNFEKEIIQIDFSRSVGSVGKGTLRKILHLLPFFGRVFKSLIWNKPDLVYLNFSPFGSAFYRDLTLISILKLFSCSNVFQLRILGIRYAKGLKKALYRYIFRNSNVISMSQTGTEDISGVVSKLPIIINSGIADPFQKNNFNVTTGNPNPITNILFVSNLFITKGVLDLIEVASLLSRNRNDFRIEIIGEETNELSLTILNNTIFEKGLADVVSVLGPVYNRKKYEYYMNSEIFVFPTYYPIENFPGVILEAMACGLAIVSTKWASIPEMIDDQVNGFLVDIRDIDGLVTQITRLLDSPELKKRLGEAARAQFLKKYTEKAFNERINDCFMKLTLEGL